MIREANLLRQKNILGIDPALTKIGWGVISTSSSPEINYVSSGVISTKSTELIHKRLANIARELEDIILQYQPIMIAMEETFVNMNANSSLKLGYARGAIMAIIGKYDIYFQEYKPNFIKKTVVGSGHAEKQQVLHMIKVLLPALSSTSLTFDEADALAIAYTSSVYTTYAKVN